MKSNKESNVKQQQLRNILWCVLYLTALVVLCLDLFVWRPM